VAEAEAGVAVRVKAGPLARLTFSVRPRLCLARPLVPVTVTAYEPGGVLAVVRTDSAPLPEVREAVSATLLGARLDARPFGLAGEVAAESETVPVKPSLPVTVRP